MWAINYGTRCLNIRKWTRLDRVKPVLVPFLCVCVFPLGWSGRRPLPAVAIQVWPERTHEMTSRSHGTGRHLWIVSLWRQTAPMSRKIWGWIFILPLIPQIQGVSSRSRKTGTSRVIRWLIEQPEPEETKLQPGLNLRSLLRAGWGHNQG